MTTKGVNGIGQPLNDGHKNDRMAKEWVWNGGMTPEWVGMSEWL